MREAASNQRSIRLPRKLERDRELSFSFPDHTKLTVLTLDRKSVWQVVFVPDANHPEQFWCCTEAVIAALNPGMSAGDRQAILIKLGKTNEPNIPAVEANFESGMVKYCFKQMKDRWVLQVLPSTKAAEDARRLR